MSTAVIKKHQTLIDIAIQYCGSSDALFDLADLNGLDTTAVVPPGTILNLPEVADDRLTKKRLRAYQKGGYKPVTGPLNVTQMQEGIEFWGIEIDFVVS